MFALFRIDNRQFLNINLFIYLFIYGCVGSSLLCSSFLQLGGAGATLHCGTQASHCGGFSCCGAQALSVRAQQLWLAGSRVQAQQLWRTGSVAPGMWDLPGPGVEPVSPALAGRFLTIAPPGKSQQTVFKFRMCMGFFKILNPVSMIK